jgi:hypothetical protein
MPYKHNQPRRHKIPKAKYRGSNWREYDRALQQRGRLAMWVTPEALEAGAPAKTGRRGRPSAYSDIAIVTDQVDPDHLGWLYSGFGVVGSKAAKRAPSKALPRHLALCTNSKRAR